MSLRNEVMTAGRWTGSAVLLRALVQFGQTAILARLLLPADFGLMAMAGTVVAMASLFADLGLSSALIHFPLPSLKVRSTLYVTNLGLGVALAVLVAGLSQAFAVLYGHADLVPVLSILALAFPVNALGQQSRALAQKGLRFKALAYIEIASSVLGFAIAVSAGVYGAGVYALVAGALANSVMNSGLAILFLRNGPLRFGGLDFKGARPFLAYGVHRVGEQIWNTMRQQLDVAIASVSASSTSVAYYATPRNQSLKLANTVINPVITRVGLPVMARLQGDKARLRDVYLKSIHFTSSLNFPAYAFLALFPGETVLILLGPQWEEATPYFRIFALWGLIRSTANPSGSLIYAVGMVRRAHFWNFANLMLAVPLLIAADRYWGLPGLAWTMLLLQIVLFFLAWKFLIEPACGARLQEYLSQFTSPLVGTFISGLCAWSLAHHISASPLRLSVAAIVFSCTYISVAFWIDKPWIRAVRELLSPLASIWPKSGR